MSQSMRAVERAPGDRRSAPSLSCTCVVIRCSATVSIASARRRSRYAWPKSRQMPASRDSRSRSSSATSAAGVGQRVRDHFERDADADRLGQPADLLDAAEGRRAVVVPGACFDSRRPQVDDQDAERNPPRDGQRRVRLVAPPPGASRRLLDGVRERRRPTDRPAPNCSVIGAWMLCSVRPRRRQPVRQRRRRRRRRDSRSGSASRTASIASKPCAAISRQVLAGRAAGRDRGAWISRTA